MNHNCLRSVVGFVIALALCGCASDPPSWQLREALKHGDFKKSNALIDKGSNGLNECSALWEATILNNLEAMKYYMVTGTPNCSDNKNYTVLMIAANKGFTSAAQLLLDSGASVNVRSDKGWTAMDYSAYSEHYLVWNLLKEHGGKGTVSAAQLSAQRAKAERQEREEEAEENQRSAARCARAKEQESQMCYPGNELACATAKSFVITSCD